MLREAHAILAPRRPPAAATPAEYRRLAAGREREVERALELERAAMKLVAIEEEARLARRLIERRQAALARAAEREERRAAGGLYANEKRSPNRPVYVDVHPDAWSKLKLETMRRRRRLGAVVGALTADASEKSLSQQVRASTHTPHTSRFARLLDVDDEQWMRFRVTADAAGVTAARALGVLVEREARRLGWIPREER